MTSLTQLLLLTTISIINLRESLGFGVGLVRPLSSLQPKTHHQCTLRAVKNQNDNITPSLSTHGDNSNDDASSSSSPSIVNHTRRNFLSKSSMIASSSLLLSINTINSIINPRIVMAAVDTDEDLTAKLYNPDGSLKNPEDGVGAIETEAKSRTVPISFPTKIPNSSMDALVSIDGNKIASSGESSSSSSSSTDDKTMMIEASYQIPEKWTAAPEYIDTNLSQKKACDRVVVAQLPGIFKDNKQLDKATTIGVAKALGITTSVEKGVFPNGLALADIVNGKKIRKAVASSSSSNSDDDEQERVYYEFDLAVAPDVCGSSAENLGLGFCPYDTIVLLSATIVDQTMMVCGVTCTKEEWKRSNADLKRVRNSFFVESKSMA